MSKTRDKRIVELELNNKNFEKNAQVSINTIDKLKKALKMDGAEDGFQRIEASINPNVFKPLEDGIEALNKKMGVFGKFSAGVIKNIADDAVRYGKQIWNNTIGQIQSGGSARAMNIANAKFKLEGLSVEWEKASKDISAAVDGTAYGFDAAANTAAQLATAGVELGESFGGMAHSLRAVSGIAAMTNSSYEEIGYIFSQVASLGKLQAQDAMQISTRGINVMATLGKALGKTTEEIQEMMRKGEISFATFAEAMNDAFGEQATKANETFQGAMSNVRAALSRIGEIWYGPFYNAAIKPLNAIRVAINKVKKEFDDGNDATEDFKSRLTKLMDIVSRIFTFFTESADLRFFKDIASGLNTILDFLIDVGEGFEKVLGIFKTDKAIEENEKLGASLDKLTQKELQAAKDIWEKGTYGNGQARIDNLMAAGFSEDEVKRTQAAINKFIDDGYKWSEVEKQIAANGEKVSETTKEFTANIVRAKILQTLISAKNIFSNIKMTVEDLGKVIWNVADIILHSFLETFEFNKIFKDFEDLTYRVHTFANSLINVTKNNSKLKNFFNELFKIANSAYRVFKSVASIVGTVVYSLIKVLASVFKEVKLGDAPVSKLTDKIADSAEKLAQIIKDSKIFIKIFESIVSIIKRGISFIGELPAKLKPVFEFISDGIDNLNNKVKNVTGVDIVGAIEKIINVVKKFFDVMHDPFVVEDNGATAIENWANEVKNALLEPFKKPAEVLETIKNWFANAFSNIKTDGLSFITGGIMNMVKTVLQDFFGFIYTLDVGDLLDKAKAIGAVVALITSIVVGLNINKLIKTIQEPMESIKGIVGKITGFIDTIQGSVEEVSGAIKKDLEADVFIKYAVGVGILAASIAVLGLIDTESLAKGLLALIAVMAMLTTSIVLYNKTVGEGKTAFLNTQILQLGVSIGMIAATMVILGNLSYEKLAKAMIAVTFISAIFGALTVLSNKLPSKGSWQMAVTIAALGAAILAIVPFVKTIGSMSFGSAVQGVAALLVVLGTLTGVSMAIGYVADNFNPTKAVIFSSAIAILAASVNLVIPFFYVISKLDPGGTAVAMAEFVGIIAAVGLAVGALGNVPNTAAAVTGAAGMAIVFASLNLVLPSIAALAAGFAINSDAVGNAVKTVLVLVGIVGLLEIAFGQTPNFASLIAGAAGMALVFASLNALLPAIGVLAAIPKEALTRALVAIGIITVLFGALIIGLAAANDALAEGVVLVMATLAATFFSIGYMISAIIFAIGFAAAAIGTAVLKISLAIDTFANLDGEKLKENARQLIKAIEIFANGIVEIAPIIGKAINALIDIISKLMDEAIPTLVEKWFGMLANLIGIFVEKVVSLFGNVIYSIASAIVGIIEKVFEKDDEGNSLFTRIIDIAGAGFVDGLNQLAKWAEPAAMAIVNFVIAVLNATSKALDERGDELTEAMAHALGSLLHWLIEASERLTDEVMKIGSEFFGKLIGGIVEKSYKAGQDIADVVNKLVDDFKKYFGITDGDSTGSALWKIGKKIVEDFIEGIGIMIDAAKQKAKDFVSSFVNGLVESAKENFGNVSGIGEKILDVFVHDGLNVNSPPPETVDAGKDMATGPIVGMKDALGGALTQAKTIGKKLTDTFVGSIGGDSAEGSGTNLIDSLMSMLGINTGDDNFAITPVLDTSEVDSGYSDLQSKYGNTTFGSSFGGYSSDLAYDVAGSSAGSTGLYGSGATDISGLRSDVQSLAARLDKIEVRMDTGALVGALYNGIDEKLGEKQILAGRGVYA